MIGLGASKIGRDASRVRSRIGRGASRVRSRIGRIGSRIEQGAAVSKIYVLVA